MLLFFNGMRTPIVLLSIPENQLKTAKTPILLAHFELGAHKSDLIFSMQNQLRHGIISRL